MRHRFTYQQCAFNFVNKKHENKNFLDKLKIFRKRNHDHQKMIEENYIISEVKTFYFMCVMKKFVRR